jgi:hypothetical protein
MVWGGHNRVQNEQKNPNVTQKWLCDAMPPNAGKRKQGTSCVRGSFDGTLGTLNLTEMSL